MAEGRFEHGQLIEAFSEKAAIGTPSVVVIGDSLASGFFSIPGYYRYLEDELEGKGWSVDMRSEAMPGAETDLAPSVAKELVQSGDAPDVVVIALGGNDMMRGGSPEEVYANLDEAITILKEAGVTVVLSGMLTPPGDESEYANRFNEIYVNLAQKHGILLDPLVNEALLANKDKIDGPLFDSDLMSDRIHPNRTGAKLIASDLAEEIDYALKSRFFGQNVPEHGIVEELSGVVRNRLPEHAVPDGKVDLAHEYSVL